MLFPDNITLLAWGVRLNPDQEDQLIKVAEKINAKQKLSYLINHTSRIPYIHLFEALIPTEHIAAADEVFERIVKLEQTFDVKWGQIEETQNQCLLWTQPNDQLKQLQLLLMNNLNQLREGLWKEKYNQEILDSMEQASLETWGNPYSSELLSYVVIGKSEKPLNISAMDIEWPFRRFTARRLFVATKEGNGNLTIRHQEHFKEAELLEDHDPLAELLA